MKLTFTKPTKAHYAGLVKSAQPNGKRKFRCGRCDTMTLLEKQMVPNRAGVCFVCTKCVKPKERS